MTYQIKKCVYIYVCKYNKKSVRVCVYIYGSCLDKYISVVTWPPNKNS